MLDSAEEAAWSSLVSLAFPDFTASELVKISWRRLEELLPIYGILAGEKQRLIKRAWEVLSAVGAALEEDAAAAQREAEAEQAAAAVEEQPPPAPERDPTPEQPPPPQAPEPIVVPCNAELAQQLCALHAGAYPPPAPVPALADPALPQPAPAPAASVAAESRGATPTAHAGVLPSQYTAQPLSQADPVFGASVPYGHQRAVPPDAQAHLLHLPLPARRGYRASDGGLFGPPAPASVPLPTPPAAAPHDPPAYGAAIATPAAEGVRWAVDMPYATPGLMPHLIHAGLDVSTAGVRTPAVGGGRELMTPARPPAGEEGMVGKEGGGRGKAAAATTPRGRHQRASHPRPFEVPTARRQPSLLRRRKSPTAAGAARADPNHLSSRHEVANPLGVSRHAQWEGGLRSRSRKKPGAS